MHQVPVAGARNAGEDMKREGMGEAGQKKGSDSNPVVDKAEGTGVVDRTEAGHSVEEPAGEEETAHSLGAAAADSFRHMMVAAVDIQVEGILEVEVAVPSRDIGLEAEEGHIST